jgi:hypothetical protein
MYTITADWPLASTKADCPLDAQGRFEASVMMAGPGTALVFPIDAGADEERNLPRSTCKGFVPAREFLSIPETDHLGVPITGEYPLARFSDGPAAGKIRFNTENGQWAALNVAGNVGHVLRFNPVSAFLYVIGFDQYQAFPTNFAQDLANEAGSPHFQVGETSGLAILTTKPGDFWPAFQRVRADILKHATVHGTTQLPNSAPF